MQNQKGLLSMQTKLRTLITGYFLGNWKLSKLFRESKNFSWPNHCIRENTVKNYPPIPLSYSLYHKKSFFLKKSTQTFMEPPIM